MITVEDPLPAVSATDLGFSVFWAFHFSSRYCGNNAEKYNNTVLETVESRIA